MGLNSNANRCFVCGPTNKIGLNRRFRLDDDGVCRSEWVSSSDYIGYDGVTHGGIIFCLLDDVMANLLFLKGEICVTAKADVRFKQPLGVGESIHLEGRLVKRRGKLAIIEAQAIRDPGQEIIAESIGHFIVKSETRKLIN